MISNSEIKKSVRDIIEAEEEINYQQRMGTYLHATVNGNIKSFIAIFIIGKKWVKDIKPTGTTWVKEYLTEAPWLILVFKQIYKLQPNGKKKSHYYNEISVSIATGLLLAAIQVAAKNMYF